MCYNHIMDNLTIDYSWQAQANCKDMGVDMFFLTPGKPVSKEAADACASCPVNEQCLNHALKYEAYGYWAGTLPKERKVMRKERGIELITIEYESQRLLDEDIKMIADAIADQKIKGRGRKKAECGTRSGYNAHLRKRKLDPTEVVCDACHRAQTDAIIAFKKNKQESQKELA